MKNSIILYAVRALLIVWGLSGLCHHSVGQVLLWNMKNIQKVKEQVAWPWIRKLCIENANRIILQSPVVLTSKKKSFTDNPHYYTSLGIYWWPNPKGKDFPYVRKDGYKNPEAKDFDAPKLSLLRNNLKYLSLAFYFTEESVYYEKFVEQLDAWFINEDTYMYPNFEYAQVHPGYNANKGNASGLIEAYIFNDVLESIRLVTSIRCINRKHMKGVVSWFYDFADWMQKSEIGIMESKTKNNHAIAYDVLLLNIACFTNNRILEKHIVDSFKICRIDPQIQPDGSQPYELSRNNAFNYSIYNLSHIVDFCIIAENRGRHCYARNLSVLTAAFGYLWQFLGNKDAFLHKELLNWEACEKYLIQEAQRLTRLNDVDTSFMQKNKNIAIRPTSIDHILK